MSTPRKPLPWKSRWGRRAEAFLIDTVLYPISWTLCLGLPAIVIVDFGPYTARVIQIPTVLVLVWVIAHEATSGRSGGKASVRLRIQRVDGSHPSALIMRACLKWVPPITLQSASRYADRIVAYPVSEWIELLAVVLGMVWIVLLWINARQERGWLDRICGTWVTDQEYLEDNRRGFEVQTSQPR